MPYVSPEEREQHTLYGPMSEKEIAEYEAKIHQRPFSAYLEFPNQEAQKKAEIFLQSLKNKKPDAPNHGPDSYLEDTFSPWLIESLGLDRNRENGLEIKFLKLPKNFRNPEHFVEFLCKLLAKNGIEMAKKEGKSEYYVVVTNPNLDETKSG